MLLYFYRFILASIVILGHIGPFRFRPGYSVIGFYIISGYLITYITKEVYNSYYNYIINRFLRIYPTYWLCLVISLVLICLFPHIAKSLHHYMDIKKINIYNAIVNFFIIGSGPLIKPKCHNISFLIIPQSWTLHVELIFYLTITFIFSNFKKTVFFLILGVTIHLFYILFNKHNWILIYTPIYSALLPFALGASIYYIKKLSLKIHQANYILLFFIILATFHTIFPFVSPSFWGFYLNILFQFLAIFLIVHSSMRFDGKKQNFLKLLGDLSYPMYLTHRAIAIPLKKYFGLPNHSFLFFLICYIATIMVSYFIVLYEKKWINPIRNKVRNGSFEIVRPKLL